MANGNSGVPLGGYCQAGGGGPGEGQSQSFSSFAHQQPGRRRMNLPDTLSVLDLEDLMAALGRPTDRTNIARALAQNPIEGVVAPEGRGRAWRIPRAALLPVT